MNIQGGEYFFQAERCSPPNKVNIKVLYEHWLPIESGVQI